MKTKKGFSIRNVCGENIVVAEGIENIDFSRVISMNESAAYLWNKIQGREFTLDEMVRLLLDEYEVDEATARKDAQTLVDQWQEAGIIDL